MLGRGGALGVLLLAAGLLVQLASGQNVASTIAGRPDLSVLNAVIDRAGLTAALSDVAFTGTILAPTDAAFSAALTSIGVNATEVLAMSQAQLQPLLLYHALPAAYNSTVILGNAANTFTLTTLKATPPNTLTIDKASGSISIQALGSTAGVATPDIDTGAPSSVIHTVDAVLLPFYTTMAQAVQRLNLTTLLTAAQTANLVTDVANPNNTWTLFAPTDAAFAATLSYINYTVAELLSAPNVVAAILEAHVIAAPVASAQLANAATIGGAQLTVRRTGGQVKVASLSGDEATVVTADLPVGLSTVGLGPRSLVHVIDRVLLPFDTSVAGALRRMGGFNILLQTIGQSPEILEYFSDPTLSGTVLAPSDAAFNAMLAQLGTEAGLRLLANPNVLIAFLATHVIGDAYINSTSFTVGTSYTTLGGGNVTAVLNGTGALSFVTAKSRANVLRTDVNVLNRAVIHEIDAVLVPPSLLDVIKATPDLSLLLSALEATGLNNTLDNPGLSWTLFAPTDAAVTAALTTLNTTLEGLVPYLAPVLLYHVLGTRIGSFEIPINNRTMVPSLLNATATQYLELSVLRNSTSVRVSGVGSEAQVARPDVAAGASVIHVVDTVLLPLYPNIAQAVQARPTLSKLLQAAVSTSLAAELADPSKRWTVFAPTDSGINSTLARLGMTEAQLFANPDMLRKILLAHIVDVAIPSANLTSPIASNVISRRTLEPNTTLVAQRVGGQAQVSVFGNTAKVITPDLPVGLGPRSIVHEIDGVLLPFYTSVLTAFSGAGGFNTLQTALSIAGPLAERLASPTFRGTVLAPSDAAFNATLVALGDRAMQLLGNPAVLNAFLGLHILENQYINSTSFVNGTTYTAASGGSFTARVDSTGRVSLATPKSLVNVQRKDIDVMGRVVIHEIDAVLVPPSLLDVIKATPDLSLLLAALEATGLNNTLDDPGLGGTLFAPNNAAFQAALGPLNITASQLNLLAPVLSYHVHGAAPRLESSFVLNTRTALSTLLVPTVNISVTNQGSNGVRVNGIGSDANVIVGNVPAGASVIHVVDAVLFPFFTSIAQAVMRTPALSTLLNATSAAGLAAALSDPTLTYTVFAPTDASIAGTLDAAALTAGALLSSPQLASILQYHILPRRVNSTALVAASGSRYDTAKAGDSLIARASNGTVTIQPGSGISARVVQADIFIGLQQRSVIHLVDRMLLPFPVTVAAAAAARNFTSFLAAVQADAGYSAAASNASFRGTVFAPTDAAFAALLKDLNVTLAALANNRTALKQILDLHVVPNQIVTSATVQNGSSITTAGGGRLTVRTVPSNTAFNVSLTAPDSSANMASTGVSINLDGRAQINVIDAVLLPAGIKKAPAAAPNNGAASALAAPSLLSLLGALLAAVCLHAFAAA